MPRIFLDCDGVLADFDKAATAILGQTPRRFQQQFSLKQFWRKLGSVPDFFAELALLPDAMELYRAVRHLDPVILAECRCAAIGPSRRNDAGPNGISPACRSSPRPRH